MSIVAYLNTHSLIYVVCCAEPGICVRPCRLKALLRSLPALLPALSAASCAARKGNASDSCVTKGRSPARHSAPASLPPCATTAQLRHLCCSPTCHT